MATTCEGSLRIRGPKDNIQRFLLNGLEPHNSTKKLEIKDGDILFFLSCHIKGTERGSVSYIEAYLTDYSAHR